MGASRHVSVEEYHRMIDCGFFVNDDRFELLEGGIVPRPTRDPPNATTMQLVRRALESRLPPGWHVRTQSGFTTEDSEPEPAVAVVRGGPQDYVVRHPGAADAAVVVEVSNARLDLDRSIKRRLYARAGVTAYWIVNLCDLRVEVYKDPRKSEAGASYLRQEKSLPGQTVSLRVGGVDLLIPVDDILP
jgi:Uma2 family endonuclease